MSLKLAFLLAGAVALAGVAFGYYLRLIISLGKKGSMELEIKQKMLEAEEESKKIITEAEAKADKLLYETRLDIKEKELESKKTEDRLVKKEELLDRRQTDIDKEVEVIKQKVGEIKTIREKADQLQSEKQSELEKVANLNEEDAKKELLDIIEKKYEEDLLVRTQKMEMMGEENLEQKAKEILTTSIQRLANSVSSDMLA